MKINKGDLRMFEILSAHTNLTAEETIQQAFELFLDTAELFLDTADLSIDEQKKLMALRVQTPEFKEVKLNLTQEQKKTLDQIKSHKTTDEIYAKLLHLYIGYLCLPDNIRQSVDFVLKGK